jgi:hypothetical protein
MMSLKSMKSKVIEKLKGKSKRKHKGKKAPITPETDEDMLQTEMSEMAELYDEDSDLMSNEQDLSS